MKLKKVMIMSVITTMLLGNTLCAQAASTSYSYDQKVTGMATINLQKAFVNPGTYSAWLSGSLAPACQNAYFSVGAGTNNFTNVKSITKLNGARQELYRSKGFNTTQKVANIALYKNSTRVATTKSTV